MAGKNLLVLQGQTLMARAIACARRSALVNDIIVSTDSEQIADEAINCGLDVPFRRPADMATDAAAKIHAIRHATQWVEAHRGFSPDVVVDLDVGVPLRAPEDIDACVNQLLGDSRLDAVVTVYEAERNPYFNMVEVSDGIARLVCPPAGDSLVRRQDAPKVMSVSPSVFAFRRSSLERVVHLGHGTWGTVEVPRERALDIDTPVDAAIAAVFLARHAGPS